jgi:glycosyltransferase involved in cell wall biosynthesis
LKKVLVFSANTSWYLYNFRKSTIKAFIKDGYEVFCLSPHDKYAALLEEFGCKWIPIRINNRGFNPFQDIGLFINFVKIYYKVKPLAVFNFTIKNNIYSTFASYLLKIPSINNISGLGTAYIHNSFKYKLARFLYRIAIKLSSNIFCQNNDDYKFFIDNKFIDESKIDLLPGSGVDLKKFSRKNDQSNQNNDFIFLYSGRFLYDKGLIELINAFDMIDQQAFSSQLWMIGFQDSKNISSIEQSVINEWSLKSNIKIFNPTDEIEKVLSEASCFVLPSYREGMPRSILEACSMQLPIICTNVPGCRDIVTNGVNGLLCEPKNVKSLFEVMKEMLQMSSKMRAKMGTEGRRRVERHFSEQIVIDKAKSALENVLS